MSGTGRRGTVTGLVSPYPIGEALPAVYLEDDFTRRFTAGLDDVMAPILLSLDCQDAYLDLDLAPPDFLDWLAGWLAVPVDESWPVELRRKVARHAVELHRWRGTTRGIALALEVVTGGEVEVVDTGGVSCSQVPTETPVPAGPATVRVRVRVADPSAVDQARLRQVLTTTVPAHVRATVEVTT